jgi:arabinogalactan endo-1,4-beta-galactosidase
MLLVAACLVWNAWSPAPAHARPQNDPPDTLDFSLGADLSFLAQLEASGATYTENGQARDPVRLLRAKGIDTVRLRLWNTPASGHDDLAETVRMAQRARAAGLRILLDIQYSDTWADPGHQTKPAAWKGLDFDELRKSVRSYTATAVGALRMANALPEVIQIGNEITAGFLWDDGRVGGKFDTDEQWKHFAALLKAAIAGAQDPLDKNDHVKIMIHVDRGGDPAGARAFFDKLEKEDVPFDVIGLSYYPWWQGSMDDLAQTMSVLAHRFGKPIVVAETAYPWTLSWFDDVKNSVGEQSQILPAYEASPEGQAAFLRDLLKTIAAVPGGLGRGLVYWSPEDVSIPGVGSSWENLTLFDYNGEILPAAGVFKEFRAARP